MACCKGYDKIVHILLEMGAEVKSFENRGERTQRCSVL